MLEPGSRLYLGEKPLCSKSRSKVRVKNLDRDIAVVFHIMSEIDGRHPTRTDLPVYLIPAFKRRRQPGEDITHSLKDAVSAPPAIERALAGAAARDTDSTACSYP